MDIPLDHQVRHASFQVLKKLQIEYSNCIPREILLKGFEFQAQRVPFVGPQGIFKPRLLPEIPLSIYTAPIIEGRRRPYEDKEMYNGFIEYKYRGEKPDHHENVGLRKALAQKVPLIYIQGLTPGFCAASWPVFIVGDDPKSLTFMVRVDEEKYTFPEEARSSNYEEESARRAYRTVETQQRVHQQGFRLRVLKAYQEHCAICNLGHPSLLDAAHILPDGHPKGEPTINNGISLCRIHHAAYDVNIIGIRPDYKVVVNEQVLKEKDGPMLKHGLQEFHESKLILPKSHRDYPKEDFLDERFQSFLAS